jgi:uncharacterized protein (DUF1697 family)
MTAEQTEISYIVFLRGINVSGRNIKMVQLKDCLEPLNLNSLRTILQSGNVIFNSHLKATQLKVSIENALRLEFTYDAKVHVFTTKQLKKTIDNYPYSTDNNNLHNYVIFFEDGLEESIISDYYVLAKDEKVSKGEGVVYWQVTKGDTLSSGFAKLLTRAKYKSFNTNRNLNTLKKIIRIS